MLIKNISISECGVPNLKNVLVMVQPGETVEVNDVKGKYLTSSYGHVFAQVNTETKVKEEEPKKEEAKIEAPKEDRIVNYTVDGDKICATFSDFVNLQESPVGFGDTEEEAKAELLKEEAKPNIPKTDDLDLGLDIQSAPTTVNVAPEPKIEELTAIYVEKFGKAVPNNKKNDIEWIKTKINS